MAILGVLNILLGMNAKAVGDSAKKVHGHLQGMEHAAHRAESALRAIGIGLGVYEGIEFLKSSTE